MDTPELRGYPFDSDLSRILRIERDARRACRQARRRTRRQADRRFAWLLR